MTKFKGNVVVITGAGSGIGRALAIEAATRGARLALSDVNADGLAQTVRELPAGTNATTHVVDVRNRADWERYAREALTAHGGVDILINNAGVAVHRSFEELSYEQLSLVLDVNLWGVIHGIKALLPTLRKSPFAHIVNIASVNSYVPLPNNAAYNMAKSAVLGLSESLMQELDGSTIRVTSVHPGAIKTNLVRNSEGFSDEQIAYFDNFAKTSPAQAAHAICKAVERNRQYLLIGKDAWMMWLGRWFMPAHFTLLVSRVTLKQAREAQARAQERAREAPP